MVLESDGTSSVLNVPALTSFTETNGRTYSTLQASNGGTVNDNSLASLTNVNFNVSGTGVEPHAQRSDLVQRPATSRSAAGRR